MDEPCTAYFVVMADCVWVLCLTLVRISLLLDNVRLYSGLSAGVAFCGPCITFRICLYPQVSGWLRAGRRAVYATSKHAQQTTFTSVQGAQQASTTLLQRAQQAQQAAAQQAQRALAAVRGVGPAVWGWAEGVAQRAQWAAQQAQQAWARVARAVAGAAQSVQGFWEGLVQWLQRAVRRS